MDAAILEAALDLLIERGIGDTSIEQVAQRAGVTRATIYRRFPDKIQLLIAAIHSGYGLPAELPEFSEPVDVEEMLSTWARALSTPDGGRGRRLLRRLMTSLHDYPELEAAYTKASIEPRNLAIRAVLERARERGQFPPDTDLDVVRQILTGAIATHLLTKPDDSTARETEEFFLAVLRETRYRRSP